MESEPTQGEPTQTNQAQSASIVRNRPIIAPVSPRSSPVVWVGSARVDFMNSNLRARTAGGPSEQYGWVRLGSRAVPRLVEASSGLLPRNSNF